jgi:acetyl esterase
MPLDPKVNQLIAGANRLHTGTYAQMGVAAARKFYDKASRAVELPLASLGTLELVQDHSLELPDRTLLIRQYGSQAPSWFSSEPALLFFHGGGFTIGSVFTHDYICRAIADLSGVQVFSVEYRLAPEHKFPGAALDAFASLEWIFAQAQTLGLDPNRIAVGGDSAGGTLAAACAIHARSKQLPLALQWLIYPGLSAHQDTPSHQRMQTGVLLDGETVQWFFEQYLRSAKDREDWRFAPLLFPDFSGLAPAYIASAQFDPLVDEAADFAKRLKAAQVPVHYQQFDGLIHAFLHHSAFVPAAKQARERVAFALRDALLTPNTFFSHYG